MIEINILLSCTYCGVKKEHVIPAEDFRHFIANRPDRISLPDGWSHGTIYMSPRQTVECEICSKHTHY
jgi:hypothetical protein